MSLFGSLMGDFEEDPFFGAHMRSMRQMNDMMNSMFSNPFGMLGGMGFPALEGPRSQNSPASRGCQDLMPFGFPNMNSIFQNFEHMANNPNCHSFSSSTVMTMSSGPDGKPQVYQASSSTRTAPGGIKEVKKTVCDSRSGTKKMAVGHHIGERAHYLEREQNMYSGEQEERQDFINLEEDEAEEFNKEFEQKARNTVGSINYPSAHLPSRRHRDMLALPSSSIHSKERSRKRDHEPESLLERSHKSLKSSSSTSNENP
ncbi:myeloid leukemia factor isoform X2 [Schistocerca piceifrons]|uniref:myeloid leukemia factor isoform X2 n=1 Tax=Schistocerca piceifrons TaxID=274613 RepID=UPI001F5F43FF|nr:myeloid leukemia factor isoform X2 [Schistocerca piceifrons]XP_049774308.1 myeloid leukemia factor isoform X2 [Schistocerca cancellata]XP_049949732.1 myeloid leukemia factor isoform X2 [Schistocerca serialis cubense]